MSYSKAKVNTLLLVGLMFLFVGCGGGQTDLTASQINTSNNTTNNQNTDPSPNNNDPAPSEQTPTDTNTPIFGGSGAVTLRWSAPSTYTDGSSLVASLAGHNIYVTNGNGYIKVQTINNPSVSEFIVENLSNGTFTFVITAFDANGIESDFSNPEIISISS